MGVRLVEAAERDVRETVVADLRQVSVDLASVHPPFLSNQGGDEWILASSAAAAIAALRDLGGDDLYGEDEWRDLESELEAQWLLPERVPEDHPYYETYAEEWGGASPLWWVEVAAGTPGAARYWRHCV